MKKIIITNYLTNSVSIVTISSDLLKQYNGDIEVCLIENSMVYNSIDCHWMELELDQFGNYEIAFEVLETKK